MKRARVYYTKRLVGELLAQDGIHYFSYDAQDPSRFIARR